MGTAYNRKMLNASQLNNALAPAVSVGAAIISLAAYLLNRQGAKRALNLEAQKMLLEVNRQLLSDPTLFAFYDDHPIRNSAFFDGNSPLFRARLEAFAYLQLNMFEIVLHEIQKPRKHRKKAPSVLWHEFFRYTVAHSSVARAILDQPESADLYNPDLLRVYARWKGEQLKAKIPESPQGA
jgi:hypothetical protein